MKPHNGEYVIVPEAGPQYELADTTEVGIIAHEIDDKYYNIPITIKDISRIRSMDWTCYVELDVSNDDCLEVRARRHLNKVLSTPIMKIAGDYILKLYEGKVIIHINN